MQRLRLFALFHVNLAFSSIPEEHRPVVLERCYWPLLRMVRRLALPVGLLLCGLVGVCAEGKAGGERGENGEREE